MEKDNAPASNSSNHGMEVSVNEKTEMTIPVFGSLQSFKLSVSKIREGESRLIESRIVNPGTYSDLEYIFNEGYREAKSNLSVVMYEITKSEKVLREVKSRHLLDEYPDFLKEKKIKDNSDVREAYLQRIAEYVSAKDRIDLLKAVESSMEGKIKVFENVCRYMKVQMNIEIRSGVDSNKYIR
jgi:hypothetical protein